MKKMLLFLLFVPLFLGAETIEVEKSDFIELLNRSMTYGTNDFLYKNIQSLEYHYQTLGVSRTNTNGILSTVYEFSLYEKELPKNGYSNTLIFTNSFTTYEKPRQNIDKKQKVVYAAVSGGIGFILGALLKGFLSN